MLDRFGQIITKWANETGRRGDGGKSLEDSQQRVGAYFNSRILPHSSAGDNVLIATHGNSLRQVIMMQGQVESR